MVTIPADCMKVNFVFDLYDTGTPVDQGVFGFHGQRIHFNGNPTDWADDVQALAQSMHDKWMSGMATSRWSPAVVMNRVDVYHLSTANKVLDKGSVPFSPVDEWVGSAQQGLPWESALVVSLYDYAPGGFAQNARNRRGRFYMPPLGVSQITTYSGVLTTDAQTNLLSAFSAWLNDVQGTHIGTPAPTQENDYFNLGILSTVKSEIYAANYVRLGRVIDVQRRRRKSQEERYTSSPIEHS